MHEFTMEESNMLKEKQLRESPFYYRSAQVNKEGYVTLISVEDYLLTYEFTEYLNQNGYKMRKNKKDRRFTTCFVPEDG